MKKYLIALSFLIATTVSASFQPATLYKEYNDVIIRTAVYTEEQADYLFSEGFLLEQEDMGATVTTINATDRISDSRAVINTNFDNLNADKIETSTTTLPNITTLTGLTTVGTIGTGTWEGTAIDPAYGGTGSTTPEDGYVMLGADTSGLKTTAGQGTSGQFLTSNGAGADPTWQTSAVNESDDYDWTGEHSFSATTTMASTTISEIILGNNSLNVENNLSKFGGDGSDGALVTTATTTIDIENNQYIAKNYTSIDIELGEGLAFSNPNSSGSLIVIKSQGACNIAGMIDASAMGGAGGAVGAEGGADSSAGANSYYIIDDTTTHSGRPTTSSGQAGGTGGTVLLLKRLYTS